MEVMNNLEQSESEPEDSQQEQATTQDSVQGAGGTEEQQEETAAAPETGEIAAPREKRRTRKKDTIDPDKLVPRASIWPFALAIAIVVLCIGLVLNPIVLGIGAVLVIVAIIGWGVERR